MNADDFVPQGNAAGIRRACRLFRGLFLLLMFFLGLVPPAARGADDVDFRVSFGSAGLQRTVTVNWDVPGTLEVATVLGRWAKVTNSVNLLVTGRRTVTLEYPTLLFPRQLFFRLQLPDEDEDEHRHVFEVTDPFVPGMEVQAVDPSWTFNRPEPIHRIRLHLVRCADTSGANRVSLQTNEFQKYVDEANTIFFRSGIVFDWNPVTDVEDVSNTAMNSEVTLLVPASSLNDQTKPPQEGVHYTRTNNSNARSALALSRKGKLVVFSVQFGSLDAEEFYWDGSGRWRQKVLTGGYSSWSGQTVVLPGSLQGLHLLAHEVGHYLNNMHTFSQPDMDNDGRGGELSDVQEYIRRELFNGDTAPAGILARFDADRYWVRDTPPDPGTRLITALNSDDACAPAMNGTVTVTVAAGGAYPGTHTYAFAPDRLNLQSYFRCNNLGVMRQSPDQIARTRDALENRHRHHLIARHMGPLVASQLSQTDLLSSGVAIQPDLQLERVRHNQLVSARRRLPENQFQLHAYAVDEAGAVTLEGSVSGEPCESFKMVQMGLGLVVIAYVTPDRHPAFQVYRLSATSTWSLVSSWIWVLSDVREIDVARFGRVNLALACRTSSAADNTSIYCFTISADGSIQFQSQNDLGTSSQLALASAGSRDLAVSRRDADGNLLLETWRISSEREPGATLERLDAASAGAVLKAGVLCMDSDRLVTPVTTGAGDLKLIDWTIDADGHLTRLGNGTTVTGLANWEAARFSTDLVAISARSDAGGLAVRLYQTGTDGSFALRQSNSSQLTGASSRSQPVCALIRDQHLAVARYGADGTAELRIYNAPFQP